MVNVKQEFFKKLSGGHVKRFYEFDSHIDYLDYKNYLKEQYELYKQENAKKREKKWEKARKDRENREKIEKNRKKEIENCFWKPRDNLTYKFRKVCNLRDTIKLEKLYFILGAQKLINLDVDRFTISADDFAVHKKVFGDTYTKGSTQIYEDLKTISDETYFNAMDTILDTSTNLFFIKRVSPRLLIYITTGKTFTINRVSNNTLKSFNGDPSKYLNLRERKVVEALPNGNIGIIRDRVKFYKDFYEGKRV